MSADDHHNAFDDVTPEYDEDAALDFHESAPLEDNATAPANGPASAAPPRIVAEAPLGGVPKPIVPPVPLAHDTPSAATSPASGESTSPAAASTDAGESAPDPDDPTLDDMPEAAQDAGPEAAQDAGPEATSGVAEERHATEEDQPPGDAPAAPVPVTPPDPNDSTIESPTLAVEARRIVAEMQDTEGEVASDTSTPDAPASDESAPTDTPQPESDATPPAHRPLPPQPDPVAGVGMAEASDFEDISPELAAILGKPATPAAAAPAAPDAATAAPAAPDAATASSDALADVAPEPEPAATPIQLTDIADVRRLPITAEHRSASAPDTTLTGKVRYVRVEEPLRNDEGQRTQETWEYLKPDYPALGGRLVKEITIEEIAHSDGSWEWRYERRYTDKGRDLREARANADRSYIEREDEVSRLDEETGRRLQFREAAELIFGPPEKEEKRGGLLSGLFGRGDGDAEADGPRSWRTASASEVKQARKQGGEAFKRGGFLGL